jgi:hypothetical protein
VIDAAVYARYMTAIADRTKAPLADGTNALYYVTLSRDLSTAEFEAAAQKVFEEYDDFGFPPPHVFLGYAKPAPVFDTAALARQIERLSVYSPQSNMIPPPAGTVREHFGNVVADAYATVSGARLFANDDTTRAIAQREFGVALTEYAAQPDNRPLIASPVEARQIANRYAKPESIAAIVQRALPSAPSGDTP